jgi:hypothetical protein
LSGSASAALSAEVVRATSAELSLTNNLSAEVSARISDVDAEESRALSAELVLTNNLSAEVSNRVVAIDAEASIRLAADNSIATNLSSELVDRAVAVSTEASLRVAADASIAANLSSEIVNRTADVDAEESRATSAELVLTNALSSEVSRAEAAEASIALELSSEVSYIIANTDLTSIDSFAEVVADMSSEVADRIAADSSLATAFANIYAKKVAVAGTIDGTNVTFTFSDALRSSSEAVYLNGLLQIAGDDYTLTNSGTSSMCIGVVFDEAPAAGSKVTAYGVY